MSDFLVQNQEYLISKCCEVLGLKKQMFMDLLCVSPSISKTSLYWSRVVVTSVVIDFIKNAGIPDNSIMSLLNYPIDENDDESGCLLYLILDIEELGYILETANRQIKKFKILLGET